MKKTNQPLSPVVLHPGSDAACGLAIVGAVMCAIILLLSLAIPEVHPVYCCFVLVGFLPLILLSLLIDALSPARITVSPDGVHLFIRRSKAEIDLPWVKFRHMYRLEGNKRCVYLFTPAPMSKEEQISCCKACVKNKAFPFTHEGCLILNAWNDGNTIDPRIPEHIQKMNWKFCAKI